MTLKELQIGKSAIVDAVGGAGALRQHFLDMGLIPGAEVTLVKLAPMGDPMELRIHGYELTLRLDDAAQITVTPTEKTPAVHAPVDGKMVEHPGLGEGGKYHTKEGEHPLPEDKTLTFALAGNQNCGKTTLFNQLTGSNQHVGNFPGVTVDRKSGAIKGHPETEVTDLPGIYSMSPYSSEEIVTRQFIIGEKPTGIINIVDATNIERNLYLTMQLMELDIPMVLALNMMDEMRGNGGTVRINKMEAMLGIPVIPISAAKNEGVDELVDHAVHVAKYQERPGRMDFCSEDDHGGAVHRCIHGILHLIEDHAKAAGIPVRFAATKLVEGDPRIEEALKLDPNEKEMIEHIIVQMEQERGLDRAAAIADMRFSFIQELVAQTVVKPHESKEQLRSNRIDKFLTGKYTAIPAFIAIMGLVFFLTFNVIGLFFQNLMEMGIDALTGVVDTALTNWNVNAAVHSLVIDGIFTGVGSVLSFLPIIVVLFFFLSMLEDTGYMARVAFVMDKLLRRIGLSGRSIVPMLIGFGCTVPGVMASRTLPSERDRKMTILLTPFMSCSAKLPVYGLIAGAFFSEHRGLVILSLYVLGVMLGILSGLIFRKAASNKQEAPFVIELPPYRMPSARNVFTHVWERVEHFLEKAGTIIFAMSVVLWFMQSFDFRLNFISDPSLSILGAIGSAIAPIFKPLGFGSWQASVALLTGVVAKEAVVSSLSMFASFSASAGGEVVRQALSGIFTPASAYSFLVFVLLYTPCMAAIATIRREMQSRAWTAFAVVWQLASAYIMSLLTYNIIGLFTGETDKAVLFYAVAALIVIYSAYCIIMRRRRGCGCGCSGCRSAAKCSQKKHL